MKAQTALSVAYGTGSRASEVVALKITGIDSQRMTLRVEQGKGQGSLRDVATAAARTVAYLVESGPGAGDARRRMVVPWHDSDPIRSLRAS